MKRTFTVWMPKGWGKGLKSGNLVGRLFWRSRRTKSRIIFEGRKAEKVRVTISTEGGR